MPSAGQRVRAVDFPATVSDTQNTTGTTTSASYTSTLTGGTACGVAFVAPTSGQVKVFNTLQMSLSAAANGFCTIRVREGSTIGSGTDVLTSSDDNATILGASASTDLTRQTAVTLVTGLTPGASYNARQEFKSDGTVTLTTRRKQLVVEPAP